MYSKLRSFQANLQERGLSKKRLYFAKVDVRSCFDTIPQDRALDLIKKLASKDEYRIERHVELKVAEVCGGQGRGMSSMRPARKFIATARGSDEFCSFPQKVESDFAPGKKNSIFVDQVAQTFQKKTGLLELLAEHIKGNIVKIGSKYYRQQAGIPQGSVVSSLLCNFFYADFERERLGFLQKGDNLLLRLIDDFLLISPNHNQTERFLQVMHGGNADHGVSVNPAKTLVNFEANVGGLMVAQVESNMLFPYCGNLIDMQSLDISKDRSKRANAGKPLKPGCVVRNKLMATGGSDSLTVEYSRVPGKNFRRKALKYVSQIDHFFSSIRFRCCILLGPKKHATAGIRWSSPTQLLIRRSVAYVWQSGRDAQFSTVYGRMYKRWSWKEIYCACHQLCFALLFTFISQAFACGLLTLQAVH